MNMKRNIVLLCLLLATCTAFGSERYSDGERNADGLADGQLYKDKADRPNTKKINFGIKAGFNSSMFMRSAPGCWSETRCCR